MTMSFSDFQAAPNQGARPDLYEIENQALDPDGVVLAAMRELAPWAGRTLVDLGCGSGFWLPGYAAEAATVIGVVVDNDYRAGEFAGLLRAAANTAQGRADDTDAWWGSGGPPGPR
jgi:methylase of polypeptide subunit release factors